MLTKTKYYELVERIVGYYVYTRNTQIFNFDKEELKQEIRLKCIDVYPKIGNNFKIGQVYLFVKECIHNYLYNLQRGIILPNNSPCSRCKNRIKCIKSKQCDKTKKYYRKLLMKRKILKPYSLYIEHDETKIIGKVC